MSVITDLSTLSEFRGGPTEKGPDRKGARLLEMTQESCEVSPLATGRAAGPRASGSHHDSR